MLASLNPANLLTFSRVLITPLVAGLILERAYGRALVWLVVAGITDGLDGLVARRFGWVTRLGALLDPVADKALLVTVYVSLGIAGLIPPWVVWVVVGRDVLILAVAGVTLLVKDERRLDPSGWGKLSTFVQIVTGVSVIAASAFGSPLLERCAGWMLYAVVLTAAVSGLHYGWRALRTMGGHRP